MAKDYKKTVEQVDKLLEVQGRQRETLLELRRALVHKALDDPEQRLWALETKLAELRADHNGRRLPTTHQGAWEDRQLEDEIRKERRRHEVHTQSP